jgi:uncharacterized protein (TIRG00374 family)
MKKKINLLISLLIGLVLFGFFLWWMGPEAVILIVENLMWRYLALFFLLSITPFIFVTLRWQVILRGYKKKIRFWTLFKNTIAGYAVSYVTPSARVGGEPLRAYMLKKESNVDLRTGSASIIMDRFVDLFGSVFFGIVGAILFLSIPNIAFSLKLILVAMLLSLLGILTIFYYRTVTGKGSFSSLYNLFRLYKISRFENLVEAIEDMEKKMRRFFMKHKKKFLLSLLIYFIQVIFMTLEIKFLLLSFGVNASLLMIIFALNVFGLVGLIPVPAALGFLEAGESGLFQLLYGNGVIGVALSLILRVKYVIYVAAGFSIISHFSGKQVERFYMKKAVSKDMRKLKRKR